MATKKSDIDEANEALQYVPSEKQMQPQSEQQTREQIETRYRNGGMSYTEYAAAMNTLAVDEFTKDKDYREFDKSVKEELEHKRR